MYNLREYMDICLKTFCSLWQYYSNEATLDDNNYIIDIPIDNNNSISFKFKENITVQTGNNDTEDVKIMVTLKYLSNFFWKRNAIN